MFNRYARTAAASSALLLIAGVAVAQVGANQVSPSDPLPAARVLTVDDNPSADDLGVDLSGPCDELEHANDERCTGIDASTGSGNTADTSGGSGKGSDDPAGDDRGGDGGGVDDNPSADDIAEGASDGGGDSTATTVGDDSTSTTIGETTSTTFDDSTTSTTIDDSASTTIDDNDGDDNDGDDDDDDDDAIDDRYDS